MAQVWPDSFVSDESVTQAIHALRRALGDHPSRPQYIATLAKRGYRFVGALKAHNPESVLIHSAQQSERLTKHPGWARWRWLAFSGAAGLALAAIVMEVRIARRPDANIDKAIVLSQAAPPGTALASAGMLSPDGHYLAFTARDNRSGVTRLWLSRLDSGGVRVLPDSAGAARPFWSPDGRSVGFFADGAIKIVAIDTGSPKAISPVGVSPTGASWSTSNAIPRL